MKKKLFLLFIGLIIKNVICSAQLRILPGDKSINPAFIKPGKFTMDYYAVGSDLSAKKLGVFEIEIAAVNQILSIKTTLSSPGLTIDWIDNIASEENTFKTVSRTSVRETNSFYLSYEGGVTGSYTDKKSGKKTNINQKLSGEYFDIAMYPFLLRALPLKLGYNAVIPVYDYNAKDNKKIHNVLIIDVKSYVHTANITGNHDVWQVMVVEEGTGNLFNYYIDKSTRKLWRVDIIDKASEAKYVLYDKETDYNPFKTVFNRVETYKMVSAGTSAILGEAFARDNRAIKDGKGLDINIVNFNKKQVAPKGTNVVLIPYTAFYKEWFELNKKQAKIKGAGAIPLPKEALECIKYTQVYDDEGHFEFSKLMTGEYLLFVVFGCEDFFTGRVETGRADVYVNGSYQGTEVYSELFGFTQTGTASIQKVVTVKTKGETVKVKLKKT
jgi:hypothetical protein